MSDGALVYHCRYTKNWLQENSADVMDWTENSEDLKYIEKDLRSDVTRIIFIREPV